MMENHWTLVTSHADDLVQSSISQTPSRSLPTLGQLPSLNTLTTPPKPTTEHIGHDQHNFVQILGPYDGQWVLPDYVYKQHTPDSAGRLPSLSPPGLHLFMTIVRPCVYTVLSSPRRRTLKSTRALQARRSFPRLALSLPNISMLPSSPISLSGLLMTFCIEK